MSRVKLPGVIHIEVRLQDIYDGFRNDPLTCPIALACRRVVEAPVSIEVESDLVLNADDGYPLVYRLPAIAEKFIDVFDKGGDVLPIQFDAWLQEPDYV